MNGFTRSVGLALAAAGTAAGLALSTAAAAEAANKALMVNGLGAGNLTDIAMANLLGGMFGSYQRQNVPWPQQARPVTGKDSMTLTQSINIGVTNLDAAIFSSLAQLGPGEHITVVGLSAGALVVDEEIRRLAANPKAPDKSKINFVVVADSSRILFNKNRYDPTIGYQYRVPAETKYNTKVVTGEYDGYADFPDRPSNTLAVTNAIAGSQLVHIPSMLTNLNTVPAKNIKTTTNVLGGVTTSYLVPTPTLPIVILNPKLKPQEAALRKQIDAAYVRNDPKKASAATTVAPDAGAAPAASAAAEAAPAAPARKTGPAARAARVAAAARG
ncbi:MAG: PE-PPE domain-containing protein [Mycobacterium sp.]